MRLVWIFAAALGVAGHSHAQDTSACAAGKITPPPAEFTNWSDAQALKAATTPSEALRIGIPLGAARKLALAPGSSVRPAAPLERTDAGTGKAGMIAFDVVEAGVYRVALGAQAWIEVVRDGKITKSATHDHRPECSTIRKIVGFPLTPGRYVLQLTASDTPEVTVMIARAASLGAER